MRLIKYIVTLLGCLTAIIADAQVMIQFNPFTDGMQVNRLANVVLTNRYSMDMGCRVTINVKELRAGSILKIVTPPFHLNKGMNIIPADAFNKSVFSYSQNNIGYALMQTRVLMDGEYEYCFEVTLIPDKGTTIPVDYFDACFNHTVERSMPLMLLNPYDREISCNKRPNFIWQPSIPFQPSLTYTLVLAEVKTKQSKAEAIAYNQPLIVQNNISTNMLNFPAMATALEEDKTYAWQVLASQGKMIVARSEIWEYKVACEKKETVTGNDGFRELSENRDEGSYIAKRWLRFVFYNAYGTSDLNYSITDLSQKDKNVKGVSKLIMQAGYNKYEIDLSEIKSLMADHQYLLTITMQNSKKMYLSFIYKEGETNND